MRRSAPPIPNPLIRTRTRTRSTGVDETIDQFLEAPVEGHLRAPAQNLLGPFRRHCRWWHVARSRLAEGELGRETSHDLLCQLSDGHGLGSNGVECDARSLGVGGELESPGDIGGMGELTSLRSVSLDRDRLAAPGPG